MFKMKDRRQHRERFMYGTGVSAGESVFSGLHCLDDGLNGIIINTFLYSPILQNDMIIRRFYHHKPFFNHTFVVFETDSGHVFMVHLRADLNKEYGNSIFIEIKPTMWWPKRDRVMTTNVYVWNLKVFINNRARQIGHYELGFYDCRHFSRDVAKFLASRNYKIPSRS